MVFCVRSKLDFEGETRLDPSLKAPSFFVKLRCPASRRYWTRSMSSLTPLKAAWNSELEVMCSRRSSSKSLVPKASVLVP